MESVLKSLEQRNTGEELQWGCDLCKERDETVTGFNFCLDCQEVYCKACTDYHKMFKISRYHWLIDTRYISSLVSRASFFTSFTNCPNHPHSEVEFYCKDHDVVFCVDCFNSTHTFCNIHVVSNHANDASELREESEKLISQMKNATDQLKMLINLAEKMKKDFRKIKGQREQMRERLDEEMSRLSKLKEHTEAHVVLWNTICQHGSERRQFISTHLMKIQLKKLVRKISEEDQNWRNIEDELKLADDLRNVIETSDVEKFVQVEVNEAESCHKHRGAVTNYLRESKLIRAEEHTVRPNVKHPSWFYGVSMYTDGRVILCDYSLTTSCGYLYRYDPVKGTVLKLQLNCPFSATQIDDTHLAVSIPRDNTISIVTVVDELKVEKTFKTRYKSGSIAALSTGQLAVAWSIPPAFGVLDISGTELVQNSYFEHDKQGRKLKSFFYLAVDEKRNHVIQPCYEDKTVYCFDFTGEPVFRYTNPELTCPQGVAIDKCGNIYVCDNMGNSIHKLSPAGELVSIFTEGVQPGPLSICCDNTGTGFWVTQFSSRDKVMHFRLEQNTEI